MDAHGQSLLPDALHAHDRAGKAPTIEPFDSIRPALADGIGNFALRKCRRPRSGADRIESGVGSAEKSVKEWLMLNRFTNKLLRGAALSSAGRHVIRNLNLGNLEFRINTGCTIRPHYAYCLLHSARLASSLGLKKMSVIEFGCAGGAGLLALEEHAEAVEKELDLDIEIYGFDTGRGLPAPKDYRDLPYHWKEGFFAMEMDRLAPRLSRSKLVIGDVGDTVRAFISEFDPAPIGAIMHDLDFYSSTASSFELFSAQPERFLPRVYNYFDDVIGSEVELYNDHTGERLAIDEFNRGSESAKLSPAYHLITRPFVMQWYHQIRILHFFQHDKYSQFVSKDDQQLRLS